jgi:hypothetical protein
MVQLSTTLSIAYCGHSATRQSGITLDISGLYRLDPNTPLQAVNNPMHCVCLLCLGLGSAFVNILAICSGSLQLSMVMILSSTKSLTQCHQCIDMLGSFMELRILHHCDQSFVIFLYYAR